MVRRGDPDAVRSEVAREQLPEHVHRLGVERRKRLIENPQCAIAKRKARKPDPPPLALRQRAHRQAVPPRKRDAVECFRDFVG